MDERARRPIVTRPEPPADEPSPKVGLSKDEVRALLAVSATNRPAWGRVAKRAGLGLIPTALVGLLLDALIGWEATPVLLVLLIVWAAWPLLGQNRDGWT